MVQKRVLGVIGLGHVGAHVAYALAVQGIADELVLRRPERAEARKRSTGPARRRQRICPHRVSCPRR